MNINKLLNKIVEIRLNVKYYFLIFKKLLGVKVLFLNLLIKLLKLQILFINLLVNLFYLKGFLLTL